jgi:hypothetical protein
VGQNRAEASRAKLAELNPRVDLNVYTGPLTNDVLKNFKVCRSSPRRSVIDEMTPWRRSC